MAPLVLSIQVVKGKKFEIRKASIRTNQYVCLKNSTGGKAFLGLAASQEFLSGGLPSEFRPVPNSFILVRFGCIAQEIFR